MPKDERVRESTGGRLPKTERVGESTGGRLLRGEGFRHNTLVEVIHR